MRTIGERSGADSQSASIGGTAANDFQRRVLEKLARLETKMDMIAGNGQPGRMKLAEDRLVTLERNDLRRTVYDRLITAGISFAISAVIAWRDRLGLK